VLDDDQAPDKKSVRRLVLCSGKVYYDLLAQKDRRKITQVAILRLEQFYPYPDSALAGLLNVYERAEDLVWVQEEPLNTGAWNFIRPLLANMLRPGMKLTRIGRPESSSPSTGSLKTHRQQQAELVRSAFE
jgi:2-oxoglutarate dehydrogenase complex dehydrogenase (E1) component-like enzyme